MEGKLHPIRSLEPQLYTQISLPKEAQSKHITTYTQGGSHGLLLTEME